MFSLLLYFYNQRSAQYIVVILLLVALLGESAPLKTVNLLSQAVAVLCWDTLPLKLW